VQRAPLVAALTSEGHLGVYTRLGPDEYAHWAKLAERSDRPDVLEAEARASRSWFRDARLKRV
jgi:hypothetical protein